MRVCDFLLVINSNLGPILHGLGDTAVYWSKNRENRKAGKANWQG